MDLIKDSSSFIKAWFSYQIEDFWVCFTLVSSVPIGARVRRRGEIFHFISKKCVWYLFGKCGETGKYCLLLVKNGMGVAT
jgi:hypothetical protein